LLKRLIDIVAAAAGLVVLSPLLVVIAASVALVDGRPILFRQRRTGLGGRPFTIYKFRTMTNSPRVTSDGDGARITRLGALLRDTSLDELPELFNVLKGEMSLVGPRPLLPEYLDRYSAEQARRHDVKPGVTGLAQVNGRNEVDWARRLAMDVWYVDHRSLLLDLRILLRTVGVVFLRRGISAEGHATMPEFQGALSPVAPGEE
jgi:lipopolysaccharide/colanic/teichoic acid biosynthesis glycosyltransferase